VLLFVPTYGIGLVISPLTLIGLVHGVVPACASNTRCPNGAAVNLLTLIAGLILLMAIWAPTGVFFFAIAWVLLILIVPISYAAPSARRVGGGLPATALAPRDDAAAWASVPDDA
jgi:hypothetical protein